MSKRILLALGLLLLVACGGRAAVGPVATFPPEATADGRQPTAAPTTTADGGQPTAATAPAVFLPVLPGGAEATPTADSRPPTAAPIATTDSGQPTAESAPAAPPATPYVSNIPDFAPHPELGPSKLGIHVARPNSPAILEFVRAAHPAVVKGVDDLGFLAEVKAASPETVTIGRLSVENQDYGGEPEAAAAALVAAQLPQLLQHPAVDYWEGWNEPDPNLDRMEWYARFEAERVRQLAAHGLRAAVGGFSAGVPELDEFALFVPAIAAAQAHGGILTLHEYAAPDLTFLYGDPLPGYPTYPDRKSVV